MASLKKKDRVNYRKAKKGDIACSVCVLFSQRQIVGIDDADLGIQGRCSWMGFGPSRTFRIMPDHTCDLAVKKQAVQEKESAEALGFKDPEEMYRHQLWLNVGQKIQGDVKDLVREANESGSSTIDVRDIGKDLPLPSHEL